MAAVTGSDVSLVAAMIESDEMNVNYQARLTKITALIIASGAGDVEMVKLLLGKGADPNLVDNKGISALSAAAFSGHSDVAEILIRAGADLNAADTKYGFTPLAAAANRRHASIVRLLVGSGADVTIRVGNGKTALGIARDRGYDDVVQILEEAEHKAQDAEPFKRQWKSP